MRCLRQAALVGGDYSGQCRLCCPVSH
jgi:hypothetical protein